MISSRAGQDVPIRRGQLWKQKKAGYLMQVLRKDKATSWKCIKLNAGSSKHKVHQIREHDLYKCFELV